MKERMLNLFSICMDAKKSGVDAFFTYLPHIDGVNLSVFKTGWKAGKEPDTVFYIYEEHDIDLAEAYLKELISNVCTG